MVVEGGRLKISVGHSWLEELKKYLGGYVEQAVGYTTLAEERRRAGEPVVGA